MIRIVFTLVVAVVAWGALAVGAVYPWGFWPLAAAAAVAGVCGMRLTEGGQPWRLLACLTLIAVSITLQVLPLPVAWLAAVSPQALEALRLLDPAFANGVSTHHALSIHPAATRLALMLFVAFSLLLAGTTGLLTRIGAERLVTAVIVVAVIVAFAGIVQRSFSTSKVYGLWSPLEGHDPFGPFVNRNHFAGWMLMALPLTLGCFGAGVARGMRGVKPELRERILWFSSPEASKLVMTALAAGLMMLALVLTVSRSGFLAATFTVTLTVLLFAAGGSTRLRKLVLLTSLTVLSIAVISWAGLDDTRARFAGVDVEELGGRRGAWSDAWSVAERFPISGSGINTYSPAMLLYQRHSLDKHFSAAHNDYLQIAAEGGLLVGIPVFLALAVLISEIRRRLKEDRGSSAIWIRIGAVVSLVAIGGQEVFDFSLQIPGNAVMFALVSAVAIHRRPLRHARAVVE